MANHIKMALVIFIASSLLACNDQVQHIETHANTKTFGKEVTELDNNIWEVFQDKKGNYWFGSNGSGIYLYDGKALKQFTKNDGLVSNQIRGIQEDSDGNIFIETPLGVSKFDGTKFTALKVIKSPDNQWKLEPNDLWFNCNGNANHVYRYDGNNMYELQLPKQRVREVLGINEGIISYSPYTVFGINKDKSGNLWLGTVLAGAFRFDGASFLWFGEKELSRLPDGREPGVRSILEDSDGNMWLSNFKSKYKIAPNSTKGYEKQKAVDLPEEIIQDEILYFNAGIADEKGNLWMTTFGGGVWKYDGRTLSKFEINNGEDDVLLNCIYQDHSGTIWIGTNNDGVYQLKGDNFVKFAANN